MNPSQRNVNCLLVVLVRMACGGVVLVRGDYRMAKCGRAEQGCRVGAPVAAYANKSSVGGPSADFGDEHYSHVSSLCSAVL